MGARRNFDDQRPMSERDILWISNLDHVHYLYRFSRTVEVILSLLGEFYHTVLHGIDGIVAPHLHILTEEIMAAALADDDVARLGLFTREKLYAEPFGLGFSA